RGGQCAAVVALDTEPRRDPGLDSHRRATTGTVPVAIDIPDADGASRVQPPAVVELDMHVAVEATIGRQAIEGPVRPVVQVPVEALEHLVRFVPAEGEPVGPGLLVGTAQETEIVELESRRTPGVAGLESGALTSLLAEPDLCGVATE